MGRIKTLDQIMNSEVCIWAEADYAPIYIKGCTFRRYGSNPYDTYRITWSYYVEELTDEELTDEELADEGEDDDPYVPIAMAEIWTANFEDFDEAVEYMDDCSGDACGAAETALSYYKKYPKRCKHLKNDMVWGCGAEVIELHTFYVSPEFRGKGIATSILLKLPELLGQLNIEQGIITAYINPFINQTKSLSDKDSVKWFKGYFEDKVVERYSRMKTEESKEISKALEHIFEKCGFSKMGEDSEYYAVSMEYLRNQAVKKNIVPEEMLWLWEHR